MESDSDCQDNHHSVILTVIRDLHGKNGYPQRNLSRNNLRGTVIMETTIVSLVSTAIVVIATVTMVMTSLHSASSIADSWKNMEQRAGEIRRTEISADLPAAYTGGNLELMVVNEGQIDLSQFPQWDVIAQRQSGGTYHIEYTSNASPGSNQWTMAGIYLLNNSPEIFDAGILNPSEKMKLVINLNPEISENQTVRLRVTTPNGVTAQLLVTRVPPPP